MIQTLLQQLEETEARLANTAKDTKADKEAESALAQRTKELEDSRGQVSALQKDKAKLTADNKSLRKKMLEAESKFHAVAKNLKESVEDNKLLQENIDNVLKEAEGWHKKHREAEALVDQLRAEKSGLQGSRDESLKAAREEAAEKDKEIVRLKKEVLGLNHEVHDLGEKTRVSETELKSCRSQLDSLDATLRSKASSIGDLRDRLDAAVAERDSREKALEYEKGIALENKMKMELLAEQLRDEKAAMSELLEKKTREDSDLEVLSKRVASLQQVIDGHAEREEQSQSAHARQVSEKDREIQEGLEAQQKLREKIAGARREHQCQLKSCLTEFLRMAARVETLQLRVDSLVGDGETAQCFAALKDLEGLGDDCLERECELSDLAEGLEGHFSRVQQWWDQARLAVENAQVLGRSQSDQCDQRDEVIRKLEGMLRKVQDQKDEEAAAAKGRSDKLSAELAEVKERLHSSLSQHHQAVSEMSEMMEAERQASKDRIATLQKASEELERRFGAEKAASAALLEKEVANYKSLHDEALKRCSSLKSELDDASYKYLDLSNQNSRISKQIENISGDLSKYSEHLLELSLVAPEDVEDLASGGSLAPDSPMNLVGQVFALRTKFLKMTQVNQDVASKCKALQMAAA